jgi:hypothetical protein
MSDRPRIRREDPDRETPVRNWSNLYRSAGPTGASKPSANGAAVSVETTQLTAEGAAAESAPGGVSAALEPVGDEARAEIESAYRVVDEHLQEGRRAAQALSSGTATSAPGAFAPTPTGSPSAALAAESIQEMVAQGIRFYSSLAPLWASIVNAIASSANASNPAQAGTPAAAPLSPPALARGGVATATSSISIELASTRMTHVTVDFFPHAKATGFTTSGLHAIEGDLPTLKDITFAIDSHSRPVVRIRVPDHQPAGLYNGVIVDMDSCEPRGTITLRIEI